MSIVFAVVGFVLLLVLAHAAISATRKGGIHPHRHDRLREVKLSVPAGSRSSDPIEIRSYSDDSKVYSLDLSAVTCTCPDFRSRADESATSLSRCCKHLLQELEHRGLLKDAGKWDLAIVSEGFGAPRTAWTIELDTAPPVLLAASNDREWVSVFAHTKRKGERIRDASGRIDRFGWSVIKERWSYGEGPPGSRELTKIMKEIL